MTKTKRDKLLVRLKENDPKLTVNQLETFASAKNFRDRLAVVKHRNVTEHILTRLSVDKTKTVSRAATLKLAFIKHKAVILPTNLEVDMDTVERSYLRHEKSINGLANFEAEESAMEVMLKPRGVFRAILEELPVILLIILSITSGIYFAANIGSF